MTTSSGKKDAKNRQGGGTSKHWYIYVHKVCRAFHRLEQMSGRFGPGHGETITAHTHFKRHGGATAHPGTKRQPPHKYTCIHVHMLMHTRTHTHTYLDIHTHTKSHIDLQNAPNATKGFRQILWPM